MTDIVLSKSNLHNANKKVFASNTFLPYDHHIFYLFFFLSLCIIRVSKSFCWHWLLTGFTWISLAVFTEWVNIESEIGIRIVSNGQNSCTVHVKNVYGIFTNRKLHLSTIKYPHKSYRKLFFLDPLKLFKNRKEIFLSASPIPEFSDLSSFPLIS